MIDGATSALQQAAIRDLLTATIGITRLALVTDHARPPAGATAITEERPSRTMPSQRGDTTDLGNRHRVHPINSHLQAATTSPTASACRSADRD